MEWVRAAVMRMWYPVILGPRETQHLHLILEGQRWDEKEVGQAAISLEVLTSDSGEWVKLRKYNFAIKDWYYEEKSSYQLPDSEIEAFRKEE
jgi:hypothetical protein